MRSSGRDQHQPGKRSADGRSRRVHQWTQLRFDGPDAVGVARGDGRVQQRLMDVGDGGRMLGGVVRRRHEANSSGSGGRSGDACRAAQLRRYARLRGCAPWDVRHHDRLLLCAAPAVTSISPANAAQTGGASVTTNGQNFAVIDPTPSASLEVSVECSSASWTSATAVACSAASYGGGTRRTAVTVSSRVATHAGQLSFDGTRACAAERRGTAAP